MNKSSEQLERESTLKSRIKRMSFLKRAIQADEETMVNIDKTMHTARTQWAERSNELNLLQKEGAKC